MKALITFCLLLMATFALKAQTLSFEETLAYLNKAAKDETSPIKYGGMFSGIKSSYPEINSNAEMIQYLQDAISDFGANKYLTSIKVAKNGAYAMVLDGDYPINFNLFKLNRSLLLFENNIVFSKDKREIGYLRFVNDKEATRFYKALQHLNTFLTQEKDPFDN